MTRADIEERIKTVISGATNATVVIGPRFDVNGDVYEDLVTVSSDEVAGGGAPFGALWTIERVNRRDARGPIGDRDRGAPAGIRRLYQTYFIQGIYFVPAEDSQAGYMLFHDSVDLVIDAVSNQVSLGGTIVGSRELDATMTIEALESGDLAYIAEFTLEVYGDATYSPS